uniref:Uncharacterized protein n=1 Tax=Timema cristinae TaxID=61476 RepID=A0A7R9CJF6_TIMCR|nr:unnamed protein product [Timema cristinae]
MSTKSLRTVGSPPVSLILVTPSLTKSSANRRTSSVDRSCDLDEPPSTVDLGLVKFSRPRTPTVYRSLTGIGGSVGGRSQRRPSTLLQLLLLKPCLLRERHLRPFGRQIPNNL